MFVNRFFNFFIGFTNCFHLQREPFLWTEKPLQSLCIFRISRKSSRFAPQILQSDRHAALFPPFELIFCERSNAGRNGGVDESGEKISQIGHNRRHTAICGIEILPQTPDEQTKARQQRCRQENELRDKNSLGKFVRANSMNDGIHGKHTKKAKWLSQAPRSRFSESAESHRPRR